MPTLYNLCWLIAVIMHLDRIALLLPKDGVEQLWQDTRQFKADFKYAKKKAKAFVDKLKKTNQGGMLRVVCESFQAFVEHFNDLTSERAVKIHCFCVTE